MYSRFFHPSFSKDRDGLLISNLIPMPKLNFDYLIIHIMGTGVSQPKRKCDHVNAHMHSHKVNQGPWYIGVRLASDHSIPHIPACNYTSGSDSALCLLSTHWQDGRWSSSDPFSAHRTITRTLKTDQNNHSLWEGNTGPSVYSTVGS